MANGLCRDCGIQLTRDNARRWQNRWVGRCRSCESRASIKRKKAKASALYTAGMIVVAGAVGCVAAVDASSQPVPTLNGSCISPLSIFQASQAAEGTYNGITVNGQYVPIENGLTEPQVYANTKGCAADGSFSVDPPSDNGSGGGGDSTSTTDGSGSTTTTVGTSTTQPSSSTTTTMATTTSSTQPHRHIVCVLKRIHHFVIAICHRA